MWIVLLVRFSLDLAGVKILFAVDTLLTFLKVQLT
jgi:hypothetical protein